MTCILAANYNNQIYMGADIGLFNVDSGDVSIAGESKLWKEGVFLFGGAGNTDDLQTLQYKVDYDMLNMSWKTKMCNSESWWVHNFIPILKENLDSLDGMECLVGVGNELFTIQDDYSIIQLANKYEAIGRGGEYATGAMYAMEKSNMNIENKINKALTIAASCNCFIRGPFDIKGTK